MIYTSYDFGAPSFIRTIAEAAETDPHIISDIEDAYVAGGTKRGFYIADEGDVPGFRCVMLFMDELNHKSVEITGAVMTNAGVIRYFRSLRDNGVMVDVLTDSGDAQAVYRDDAPNETMARFVNELSRMTLKDLDDLQERPRVEAERGEMHLFHNSSWIPRMTNSLSRQVNDAIRMRVCPKAFKKIEATAKLRARAIVRSAQKRFKAAMDQEILKTAHTLTRLDMRAVAWMSGDGTAFSRTARLQAARDYPIFLNEMIGHPELTQTIDTGAPLRPALSALTGISQPVLKRLRTKSWRWVGSSPNRITHAQFIGLDPNDFPASGAEAKALTAHALNKSKMVGFASIRSWNIAPGRPAEMHLVADAGGGEVVRDALLHVLRHGLAPAISAHTEQLTHTGWSTLTAELAHNAGLKGALRLSETWHAAQEAIRQLEKRKEDISWTPILGAGALPHDLFFEEITSQSAIMNLGRDQKHCIATYLDEVLAFSQENKRGDFVFRIHDAEGATVSTVHVTAQLSEEWDDDYESGDILHWVPRVSQQQARYNARVSETAAKAAEALIKRIADALNAEGAAEAYEADIRACHDLHRGRRTGPRTNPALQALLVDMLPKKLKSPEAMRQLWDSAMAKVKEEPILMRTLF